MHETKQIVSKSISVSSLVSALIMELKFEHSRNGPKLNYDYPVSIIFGVPINWILGRRPPPPGVWSMDMLIILISVKTIRRDLIIKV